MPTDANVMPAVSPSIRGADPRALLLAVLVVLVASMATVRSIRGMLVLFLFAAAWHAVAVRPDATLRAARRIAPFAALILLLNAILVPGDPLLVIAGRRVVSERGLLDGTFFALRLGVMLMAVSVLIAACHAEALAQGVHDLVRRVSPRLAERMAFFTFLAIGFVPLFGDEIRRVQTAQSFRTGRVQRGLRGRVTSVHTWLVPVLMSAVRRSGQLALAVELRDVRARLIPSLPPLGLRPADVAWLVAAVVVAVFASTGR